MKPTDEQLDLIQTVLDPNVTLVKGSAVAGSGKTATLMELAKAMNPQKGLYLAYNKSIALEAATKFPSTVLCKTTHSLAYRPIVTEGLSSSHTIKKGPRKVDWFNVKSIVEYLPYTTKLEVIQAMDKFFTSPFISMTEFYHLSGYDEQVSQTAMAYIRKMANKEIPCTHAFYLKYYHILLAKGQIKIYQPYDLIMLDEFGDVNPVTLEIFKLLPAHKKVAVGDSQQNIYSFNNTINGFEALSNVGVLKTLTQSFRVAANIARPIEKFCRKYLDPHMNFKGFEYKDMTITTRGFIARTNGSLIAKMLELNKTGTKYSLTRPAKEIFELPNTLMSLKPNGIIYSTKYRFLQDDVNDYYSSNRLQTSFKTVLGYIASAHSDDRSIKSAVSLLSKVGGAEIRKAFDIAKAYETDKSAKLLTLTTAHSAKGLEWDEVTLAEDTSLESLLEVPTSAWFPQDFEECRLYYVACTRARKNLVGATSLHG